MIDIVGIGNAIVDVLAPTPDDRIESYGLVKGSMTLIDADRAAELYGVLTRTQETSGGSCANTMVAAASLGARVAYIGKVRDDVLGSSFARDIRAAGVEFSTAPSVSGPATARCLVMVSPDGQRTMSTYLGAAVELGPEDVDEELVSAAAVTYLEGYLWDPPRAKGAFRVAMAAAHRSGREVAVSLSDPFCVERFRAEFVDLVRDEVDILFANEAEIRMLYGSASTSGALARVPSRCRAVAVTCAERGSIVSVDGVVVEVPAVPVEHVVDTTGAGDAYAAGFLVGWTRGLPPAECAHLGSLAAAEVISHYGARPQTDLAALARSVLE
jgi:sugar/nucleoside kinase (ribokinase family)